MAKETIQRALPIHQPFAELIFLSGQHRKTEEYRSRATTVRERVYVYACSGGDRLTEEDEELIKGEYGVVFRKGNPGFKYIDLDSLPRGVLVGTVEITHCEGDFGEYQWHLAKPQRLPTPKKPTKKPVSGGFFYPFGKE